MHARLVFEDELAHNFYLSVTKFKAGVAKALEYAKRGVDSTALYRVAYSVIGNKRYADGAILVVREIVESARTLGVQLGSVELRDWWMLQSRGSPRPEDRGNRNIRLIDRDKARIVLYNGLSWSRYDVHVRVPRIYEKLFNTIAELGVNCRLGYLARLVALDMAYDRVYSELQVAVPYELYLEHRRRYDKPQGDNIAGVDVNADRVNLAITDTRGILRDVKTFHYPSLASPTMKGDARRTLVHKAVHDVLRYAYFHGTSTIVFEDPEVLGYLKLRWVMSNDRRGEKYNRRVSMFKASLIEEFVLHAPEYGLKAYYVDPAYTSQLGKLVAREIGLDKHSVSIHHSTGIPRTKTRTSN